MPPRSHPRSFDSDAAAAGVAAQIPLGIRTIRVKRIVGSAGKAEKLRPDFLPLGAGPASKNFHDIVLALQRGENLPAISVYQIGSRYYVIDGHTRVAAAKNLGIEFLDANVIDCLPRKEGEPNMTYYARREFESYTGLENVRLTAAWRYHLLHHHIEGYRLYLEHSRGREVSLPEAASIWYRSQFLPTLGEIRRRTLKSTTGGRTAADVYTDILRAWAEEEGLNISLREMLDYYDGTARPRLKPLARARRALSDAVDASLPKVVTPLVRPSPIRIAEMDIDAELTDDPGQGGHEAKGTS